MDIKQISYRKALYSDMFQIQKLRHEVLDPARVVKEGPTVLIEDFSGKLLNFAAFDNRKVVSAMRFYPQPEKDNYYILDKACTREEYRNLGITKKFFEYS